MKKNYDFIEIPLENVTAKEFRKHKISDVDFINMESALANNNVMEFTKIANYIYYWNTDIDISDRLISRLKDLYFDNSTKHFIEHFAKPEDAIERDFVLLIIKNVIIENIQPFLSKQEHLQNNYKEIIEDLLLDYWEAVEYIIFYHKDRNPEKYLTKDEIESIASIFLKLPLLMLDIKENFTPNKKYRKEMFEYTEKLLAKRHSLKISCIMTLEQFSDCLDPLKYESYEKRFRHYSKIKRGK